MRPELLLTCALALSSTLPAAPERQLVACFATTRDAAANSAALLTLGITMVRRLSDGLPPAPAGSSPALDPDRVWLLEARDPIAAAAASAALSRDATVAWIEPNRRRERAGAPVFPDDPMFVDSRQWGLRNLGPAGVLGGIAGADVQALDAWRLGVGSHDVLLALADTGIDPTHPELSGLLPDGRPRLVALDLAGGGAAPSDSLGHGTAVAGIFGARTGDGAHRESLGVAGLCGGDGAGNAGCRLLSLKVVTGRASHATSFDLARAILHAARAGARAVNVSFAGDGPSRLERLAMRDALALGCVTVAAAGNRGAVDGARPQYPAAYAADGLGIQVGASDRFDQRAAFSSHGPGLDLLAPGVDIWTTRTTYPNALGLAGHGYGPASGTSFAAPFATGAVGLLAAARGALDAGDFQPLLRASAHDLGAPGPDSLTGWGRLDAAAALAAVAPSHGIAHGAVPITRLRPAGTDTLAIAEDGLRVPAARFEAVAVVAVPDSFAGPVRAWPRAVGTATTRATFRMPWLAPWAEAVATGPRTFELRGWLYRVDSGAWIPVLPESARIAFTLIGPVTRPPRSAEERLRALPNPFRAAVRLESSRAGVLEIFDVAGRRVHAAALAPGRAVTWDGRDGGGSATPPGVYFARLGGSADGSIVRIVRLP